jgi:hypothetical protein
MMPLTDGYEKADKQQGLSSEILSLG